MKPIAILFARADSIYKTLPGCDVWDIQRDARRWPGGGPSALPSMGTATCLRQPAAGREGPGQMGSRPAQEMGRRTGASRRLNALVGSRPTDAREARRLGRMDAAGASALVGTSCREGDMALHRRMRTGGPSANPVPHGRAYPCGAKPEETRPSAAHHQSRARTHARGTCHVAGGSRKENRDE